MTLWRWVLGCCVAGCVAMLASAQVSYPQVVPDRKIALPHDEASHPSFRTEWWYLTGWLEDANGRSYGFQLTFFRHRPGFDEDNPSTFAAKQLLFAHASFSDPQHGKLRRAEKSARTGFGLAEANEQTLDVRIDEWRLRRTGDKMLAANVESREFRFELSLEMTQPALLHGREGFSQKTPNAELASYYYSLPHLRTNGRVWADGRQVEVRGVAWLDHEWFSSIFDDASQGWDWTGLNLNDGTSIMALQMRNGRHEMHWAAATERDASGTVRTFGPNEIDWQVVRRWRSPRTGIEYPVELRVRIGSRTIRLQPLLDDQENDARMSTGTIYWEGAVQALDDNGAQIGKGYLELTGYGERIRF